MAQWSKDPDDIIPVARGRLRRLLPSRVWHFHFKNAEGRWISRSTGHRDKRGAIRWAEGFSLDLTDQQFRPAPAPVPDGQDSPSAPSILRALVLWLRYHREQSSPETQRTYRSIALKFLRFLKERGIRDLAGITRPVLMDYRTWCLRKGNGRATVDNNLIALRSLLNWAVSKGWVTQNPASQGRVGERLFFDVEPVRKPTFTRAECERILELAEGDAHSVFTLLASWGLRISELAMLEWTDLDYRGLWVHIRRKVTHDGVAYCPKDKEDRRLPLEGKRVLAVLERLAKVTGQRGYVVPLNTRSRRPHYAERRFIDLLKDVGAKAEVDEVKLFLHNFRHYFVSECADRGIPMATVMNWVGHSDMKMVMYYYSLRETTAREAMRRLMDDEDGAPPAPRGSDTNHEPVTADRPTADHSPPPPKRHPSRGQRRRTA